LLLQFLDLLSLLGVVVGMIIKGLEVALLLDRFSG